MHARRSSIPTLPYIACLSIFSRFDLTLSRTIVPAWGHSLLDRIVALVKLAKESLRAIDIDWNASLIHPPSFFLLPDRSRPQKKRSVSGADFPCLEGPDFPRIPSA